jgi:GNAT superfamily N-acetyltransferase
MSAQDIRVVPAMHENVGAIRELLMAQQRRWHALDERLDAALSEDKLVASLGLVEAAAGLQPLMVLDAHGRVRGYACVDVWDIAPESGMLAFFTQRNGTTATLALPDPADADALLVTDALLTALERQWRDLRTLGDIFRWPCRDLWMEDLLQVHGFLVDSDLATRTTAPLLPSLRPALSHVHTRLARADDEDALVALLTEELLFHEPHTPFVRMSPVVARDFRERLQPLWAGDSPAEGAPLVVVVERDGAPIAMSENALAVLDGENYPHFLPHGRYGYFDNVSVSQNFRGEGVGRLLVQANIDAFAPYAVDGYYLWYNPANPLSRPFWLHMGFQPFWRTYQHRHAAR